MITPILALLLIPASAGQIKPSLTLSVLQAEADKAPERAGSHEAARIQAANAFTGEKASTEPPAVKPAQSKEAQGPTYHFDCKNPVQGFSLCNPVMDSPGNDSTGTPGGGSKTPKWLMDWRVHAGIAAAATAGGIFFAPLLFVGGFFAGVAAVLWFITRKSKE